MTEREDAQVLDLFTGKPPLPVERVAPPLPPTPPTPDEDKFPLQDTQIAELRYAVDGIDQSDTPAEMRYYIAEIRRILDG